MKISINKIQSLVTRPVFNRGIRYYKDNRVVLTTIDLDRFSAQVSGSEVYQVDVKLIQGELYTTCTCPYWDTCKHVVAALFKAKDYYDQHRTDLVKKKQLPQWQSFFEKLLSPEANQPNISYVTNKWKIVYTIQLAEEFWILTPQKAYLKKDGALGHLNPITSLSSENQNIEYAPNDPIIINYLQSLPSNYYLYRRYDYFHKNYYYNYTQKFMPYGEKVGMIFNLLKDSLVFETANGAINRQLIFSDTTARLEFHLINNGDSFLIQPFLSWNDRIEVFDARFRVLTEKPIWLLFNLNLIKLENDIQAQLLLSYVRPELRPKIPKKELPLFINSFLDKLGLYGSFRLPADYKVYPVHQATGKRLYLSEGEKHLLVALTVQYEEIEIDVRFPETEMYRMETDSTSIFHIHRDSKFEQSIINRLVASGLKIARAGNLQIIDSRALNWIFEQIPQLVKEGFEIYGKENLTKYKYNNARPTIKFSVSSNIDWFDLNVDIDFDGIALSLRELKKAFQKKTPYVKLIDGSLAVLPDDWFIKFEHLFNFGKIEERNVKLSKYHLTLIDLLMEQAHQVKTDEQFQEQLAKLKNFERIESRSIPTNLKGTLRGYQKTGFDWLCFLRDFSFGGCLADDMGLGKTIQALSLLLSERVDGDTRPSLVICPTSVIFNWENEVKRFAPDLRLINQTGMDRIKDSSDFDHYDIVLTSYGILIRDISFLAKYHFHYVIVDESQKMKNPFSLTARSIRLLQSDYRLALTGTPIENNTTELWSLFAFLNPGLLGSSNYFKKAFTLPIEKKQNEQIADHLRRLIFPFILRRTKDQVARELPPKIEQISYCHMNEEQQKLYHHWRNYYRAVILQQVDEVGLNRSKMRVLEGLTRLRLIACHPSLVDKEIKEDSGKYELLLDTLEEITSENHKVLIFSQFVKMLTIIRNYLDKQGFVYEYLDGSTRNREQCIEHFQNNDRVQLFLISLKAGGLGINLTAADYVILYDPWWNPAVEVQATDRTHRIGQDKKVFVYKFITKDTIEEKILQLQEQKKDLISQLITTDANFFKSLTREDIEILFA